MVNYFLWSYQPVLCKYRPISVNFIPVFDIRRDSYRCRAQLKEDCAKFSCSVIILLSYQSMNKWTTSIPSSTSPKKSASPKYLTKHVYHTYHQLTHLSAPYYQYISHSLWILITIDFSVPWRQVVLIIKYDYSKTLRTP